MAITLHYKKKTQKSDNRRLGAIKAVQPYIKKRKSVKQTVGKAAEFVQ